MSENCDKCKERNVGCDVIQQMNRDIAKLRKRKSFVALFWGFLLFAFIALAVVIVWSNFFTKKAVATPPINVQLNVADTKKLTSALDKDTIDKVLQETAQQAFYQGRIDAQSEYDRNFATLLTILTIFGIAWPVVIALLQFKFSENELKKIENANNQAQESLDKANEANKNALDSVQKANEANKNALDSVQKANEALHNQYREAARIFYFLGYEHKKQLPAPNNDTISNYYYICGIYNILRSFEIIPSNAISGDLDLYIEELDTTKIDNPGLQKIEACIKMDDNLKNNPNISDVYKNFSKIDKLLEKFKDATVY